MIYSSKMAAALASTVGLIFLMSYLKLSQAAQNVVDCECGMPSADVLSMRIVGGRRAAPHVYPWIVAIKKGGRMHCGGAIVSTLHILTAGHCIKWDDYRSMEVFLGLVNMDNMKDVETRRVAEAQLHEEFTSTPMRDENDIAILTMDRPVEFSKIVAPICLPSQGQDFSERMAIIAGWGRVGSNQPVSPHLMRTRVKILTSEDCMHSELKKHLVPTMMCAFSKGHDGCQGDSGGPLVVMENSGKFYQTGLVSWGVGCADPRYPGIYTKVSDYVAWIKEHTADGLTCSR